MHLPPLYPILDTTTIERRRLPLVDAAEAVLDGGARILQLRHKAHFSRTVFAAAEQIAQLCRDAGALLIIDDRADIARLLDAGVHVGQDDLPPAMARRVVGESAIIGFSTHDDDQLRAASAEPVDYLAVGPVFATASKANPDPVIGVEGVRALRPFTDRPLVAIGGITRETAPDVLAAGADSVAVIGDLYPVSLTRASLRQRIEEWLTLLASK